MLVQIYIQMSLEKNQAMGGLLHNPPNYLEKESFFAEKIIFPL